ncbi:MAG: hypothetical protein KJ737_26250 [Proteobacteria bacterium]|nr:hypothetical protein [Pseudomonadota bacterium]
MTERYDLEKMLKEIVEDEKGDKRIKTKGVLSQDEIKKLLEKKHADRRNQSS